MAAMWIVKLGGSLHDARRCATGCAGWRPRRGRRGSWCRAAARSPTPCGRCSRSWAWTSLRPPHGDSGDAAVRPRPPGAGASAVAGRDRRRAAGRHGRGLAALAACRRAGAIDASWDVTSDSIACWLATAWRQRLVLVKSAPVPTGACGADERPASDLLDTAFVGFARAFPGGHPYGSPRRGAG